MVRPDEFYVFVDPEGKRDIVSSMFPEKITFDGAEHRTPRLNEIVSKIHLINKELGQKK